MENGKSTKDAFDWLYQEFIGDDPERVSSYTYELTRTAIAQQVYDLRVKAGLTHEQLADMIGTSPEVIGDIEEADYEGDALVMLTKIAAALKKRIDVRISVSDAAT
ncbi:MAG: helix-turn-helix transcriptional regulator [Thermodesulfobacteriota bacterium]